MYKCKVLIMLISLDGRENYWLTVVKRLWHVIKKGHIHSEDRPVQTCVCEKDWKSVFACMCVLQNPYSFISCVKVFN